MKKLKFNFLIGILFLQNCFPQAGWYPVTTQITDLRLQRIQFTSVNTGYAVGPLFWSYRSYLLKTTNIGDNWTSTLFDSVNINSLFFVNDNTGYLFGFKESTGGIVKKTTDGGINWVNQAVGLANMFFTGYFFNSETGYVGGKYGYNYKTTDGGDTWILKYSPQIVWFDDIYFLNTNTGFGVDYKIYKTTDGGDTWDVNYDDSCFYMCIHFVNYTTGFSTGHGGRVIKTTNSGINWMPIYNFQDNNNSVFFVNPNIGYIVTSSYPSVYKTTNAGVNWFWQNTGTLYGAFSMVFFLNENTGFVAGIKGIIMKTINGGVSVKNISVEIPNKFKLFQNYPNPFNPVTIIKYMIVENGNSKTENSTVTLKVYNVIGSEVAMLVNEKQSAGVYEVTFDASEFASGVYFYRLVAGDSEASSGQVYTETKKMLLIK